MYTVELRIRMETFFGEQIEPNNITSNECKFNTLQEFPDGTIIMEFASQDATIIERIKELYKKHDYRVIPLTKEEQAILDLKSENVYLGQIITDLELSMLELQTMIMSSQVETMKNDQELGTQITDIDLELLEHKVIDHSQ